MSGEKGEERGGGRGLSGTRWDVLLEGPTGVDDGDGGQGEKARASRRTHVGEAGYATRILMGHAISR